MPKYGCKDEKPQKYFPAMIIWYKVSTFVAINVAYTKY